MITLDLRGRDLIITPPENLLSLPTPELLRLLFGTYLPTEVRNSMGRDKRHHFLRTKPIYFTAVKRALRQQQTEYSVAFEERPQLPFTPTLTMAARPDQETVLTAWLAEGSAAALAL